MTEEKIKKFNIAIDGSVGSGKTTIGKLLTAKLNYQFLDSGLLYRHFAWFYQASNSSDKESEIDKLLWQWKNELTNQGEKLVLVLEEERLKLSSPAISDLASQLAPLVELRKITLNFQRELTKNKGWVVVGRDITSEVLPQAEIKIFLTASLEKRTERRHRQYQNNSNQEAVKKELQERDERDKKRKNSPLIKTADSWELDTTNLSPTESVEKILCYITKISGEKKI